MKNNLALTLCLSVLIPLLPTQSHASTGKKGFEALKQCVMQNDATLCHEAITTDSRELFDRFASYKLMPCLPTNFTYESEQQANEFTIVKTSMPAPDNRQHILRLAFADSEGKPRLNINESLRIGLGDNWQNKIQMAENLFLMIRANAGGDFSCNQLNGLVKK